MAADGDPWWNKLNIPSAIAGSLVGSLITLATVPASKWIDRKFDDRRDERNTLILQIAEPATKLADTVGTLLTWMSCDTVEESTPAFRSSGCKPGGYARFDDRRPSKRETAVFRYGDSVSLALKLRRPQIRILFGDSVAFLTDTIRDEIDHAMRGAQFMFPDMEVAPSRAMVVREADASRRRIYEYVSKLLPFTR